MCTKLYLRLKCAVIFAHILYFFSTASTLSKERFDHMLSFYLHLLCAENFHLNTKQSCDHPLKQIYLQYRKTPNTRACYLNQVIICILNKFTKQVDSIKFASGIGLLRTWLLNFLKQGNYTTRCKT